MLRLGAAADLAANVIRKPPLFTQQSIAMTAGRFLYFDTTKARTELGYMPGPLEVAFMDAISWFKGPENNHDPRHIAARLRSRFSL
jgi:nucleoside-diphosphate-sugar epimerase